MQRLKYNEMKLVDFELLTNTKRGHRFHPFSTKKALYDRGFCPEFMAVYVQNKTRDMLHQQYSDAVLFLS